MKKIIMYLCITSLTFGVGTDVGAATDLDYVLESMNRTIEKARVDATGIEINSSIVETIKSDYYSPEGLIPSAIVLTMSNMHAQAELYYSDHNYYGPKTQVCTIGMFADAYGLGDLLKELRRNTRDINCNATDTSFVVSAKLKAGEYWCIDSTGESKGITKHIKKGATSCASGVKLVPKTKKITTTIIQTLFPINNGYNIKQEVSLVQLGNPITINRILRDKVTYMLINKDLEELSGVKRGTYLGRYLTIPNNNSTLTQTLGMTDIKMPKYMEIISNPSLTKAKFLRNNPDGSKIYAVSLSRAEMSELITQNLGSSTQKPIVDKNNESTLTLEVKIKDGIIVSIFNSSTLPGAVMSLKGRLTGKTLTLIPDNLKVACVDFVGPLGATEICNPRTSTAQ